MQLLVIRHALPLRTEPGQGADPDLSPEGVEQAKRLPEALARCSDLAAEYSLFRRSCLVWV